MLQFTRSGWETSGKLQELRTLARNGQISNRIYLLCWQIVAFGDDYVNKLNSDVLDHAIALLEL